MTPAPDRIVTVTTLRDSVDNARWFVERTLASGVDHLVVFLDQPQANVRQVLEESPDVTVVTTSRGYWQGERPQRLAERQQINATLVNAALAICPSVRWLFQVDGDQVPCFDRARVAGLDASLIRFPILEVVAERDAASRDELPFKKMPDEVELQALAGLGAIREPDLDHYLRGGARGMVGMRPSLAHRPQAPDTDDEHAPVAAGAQVLHYHSWSLDDLVGRWQDVTPRKAAEGSYTERSRRVGLAVNAIANHSELDERTRQGYLTRVFDEHVADDRRSLEIMGLLIRPELNPSEPRPLPAEELTAFRAVLGALCEAPKAPFRADAPLAAVLDALEEVAESLTDRSVAERVRAAVAAHRQGALTDAVGRREGHQDRELPRAEG